MSSEDDNPKIGEACRLRHADDCTICKSASWKFLRHTHLLRDHETLCALAHAPIRFDFTKIGE
ncbi:unnamed protein product [Larinioides sclopetarius]|uniref:Uncharacterized protein n=1 Tax=Larinioides sclopetarius TaxID=280406 RepID=A0AAV2BDU7_9ARAC